MAERYTRVEASPPNYLDWQRMNRSFETMGALTSRASNLVGGTEPRRLEGAVMSADVMRILGVSPRIGRIFADEDDELGAARTVILSYALWRSEFGGSAEVLGKRVRLDEVEHVVIGVLPATFTFPTRETQIWAPLEFSEENGDEDRDNNHLHVLARLRPGESLDAARAEMNVIAEQLERQYPSRSRNDHR